MWEFWSQVGSKKMSASAFVEEATDWAKELVHVETKRPGDHMPAMRRVARRAGVSFALLKNLHYRPPKDISVNDYLALCLDYHANEQTRKFREERARTEAKTLLGQILLRAADRLGGEDVRAVRTLEDPEPERLEPTIERRP